MGWRYFSAPGQRLLIRGPSVAVALIRSVMRERRRSRFLSMPPVNDGSQPSAEHESRPVRSDYRSEACSAGGIEMFYIGDSE